MTAAVPPRPSAQAPTLPKLAAPPRPQPPPAWRFPPPDGADQDGVVGIGADLEAPTLVHAYRNGTFPWPHAGMPLPWFSPDPRGVLDPTTLHLSRSLRRRLRRCGWTATVDRAFAAVITNCAERDRDEGTWITPAMSRAYRQLHALGWAHSVEIWEGQELVGGLYGVQVGGSFTGESMFRRAAEASKVALVELLHRFAAAGGRFVDVQLVTPHLASLGAVDVPRARYLARLQAVRDLDVRLTVDPQPVERLADLGR